MFKTISIQSIEQNQLRYKWSKSVSVFKLHELLKYVYMVSLFNKSKMQGNLNQFFSIINWYTQSNLGCQN
mgnify:FL=1